MLFAVLLLPRCYCDIIRYDTLSGVIVDPHRRQLHITMAHQYQPEVHSILEELAHSKVDPSLPSKWELRLYSRDYRLASSEVRQKGTVCVGVCLH